MPPEVLAQYEKIYPGFAERLMIALEAQGEHRRYLEQKQQAATEADQLACREIERRGQWFALLIGLAAIISGAAIACLGQPVVGAVISVAAVVGFVVAFVVAAFVVWRDRSAPEE